MFKKTPYRGKPISRSYTAHVTFAPPSTRAFHVQTNRKAAIFPVSTRKGSLSRNGSAAVRLAHSGYAPMDDKIIHLEK
jgi:hypothetical protein